MIDEAQDQLLPAGEWGKRDPSGGRPALHNVQQHFGSFDNALAAAGHPVERWDRESIAATLSELTRELGRRPIQRDLRPKRPGRPGYDTVIAQFGSLVSALEAAGLAPPRRWTREEVVAALRAWAAERGLPPTYGDWARGADGHPSTSAVEKLFGSWTEALLSADLPIRKRNWDRESILAALRAWTAEHGRAPLSSDWRGADPSGRRPAIFRVQREFGTWAAAIGAAGLATAEEPHPDRPPAPAPPLARGPDDEDMLWLRWISGGSEIRLWWIPVERPPNRPEHRRTETHEGPQTAGNSPLFASLRGPPTNRGARI